MADSSIRLPWGASSAILVSFGTLGFTVGLFAGMSESPVGAALVGAMFGLLGSGGILSLVGKIDEKKVVGRAVAVALCTTCFCLTVIGGVFLGIEIRNGDIPGVTEPAPPARELAELDAAALQDLSAERAADLLVLQRELERVGVTPRENDAVVGRVLARIKEGKESKGMSANDAAELVTRARQLKVDAAAAAAALEAASEKLTALRNTLATPERDGADAAAAADRAKLVNDALDGLERALNPAAFQLRETVSGAAEDLADRLADAQSPDLLLAIERLKAFAPPEGASGGAARAARSIASDEEPRPRRRRAIAP